MAQLVIRLTSKKPLEEAVKNINKADARINEVAFRKVNATKTEERIKRSKKT